MGILDAVFPKRCVGCGRVGTYICSFCSPSLQRISEIETICLTCGRYAQRGVTHKECRQRYYLYGLTSYFRYRGIAARAVKTLKYRFVSDLADEFVALVPPGYRKRSALVPIPLHPARRRLRGFNQAEALAGAFARRLHLPVRTDILYRTKPEEPKTESNDRQTRAAAMQGAFAARKRVKGTFVLFDDVTTTGATLLAATRALKRAGARRVWAVTMAR